MTTVNEAPNKSAEGSQNIALSLSLVRTDARQQSIVAAGLYYNKV